MLGRSVTGMVVGMLALVGCDGPASSDAGDEIEGSSGSESSSGSSSSTESSSSSSTESESSSESESSTTDTDEGSDDAFDEGEFVEPGTSPACMVSPGEHASVCPQGSPCPVLTDVEIDCGTDVDWPISVSVDDERAYLAAVGDAGGWLIRAQGDAAEITALPDLLDGGRIRLGVKQTGAPRMLAATDTDQAHVYVIPSAGSYLIQAVTETPDDPYTRPYALEFDATHHAHAMTEQDGYYLHAIRAADASWTLDPILDPDGMSVRANGFDRHGHVVELVNLAEPPFIQLGARVEGAIQVLSDPYSIGASPTEVLQPARPSSADAQDIDYAAIVWRDEELAVIWPTGPDTRTEVILPDVFANPNPCPMQQGCPCPATCVDDQGGFGMAVAARTSESEIWVAWTFDHDLVTWPNFEIVPCMCGLGLIPTIDETTTTLYLTRIDTSDASVEHVLTMPIAKPIEIDMQTWDRRLAVGMRMAKPTVRVRVLGFDLDQL